jgi:hypothetical protein
LNESEVFIVSAIEKSAFNGMGKISPEDIKLIPVSGAESEATVHEHFHQEMKHLKVIGVSSLEYLRFQERIMLEHLQENGFVLETNH